MKDYESSAQEPLPAQEKNEEKSGSDEVRRSNEREENSENSVWDGSESEFVEDDEAAVYEEKYTGIKLNYELKTDEIFNCLKNFSDYKRKNKKVIVETILLAIVFIGFLLSGIFRNDISGYIFSVISALLIAVIWVVPNLIIKSNAKEISRLGDIYVEIYPDEIIIGNNGIEKSIDLDGNSMFAVTDDLYVIIPPKGNMVIIPIRAIEPDFLPDVEAMLMAGTSPISTVE